MDPADFFRNLDLLVAKALDSSDAPYAVLDGLLRERDSLALRTIEQREQLLAQGDRDSVSGLLATGLWSAMGTQTRTAAFRVAIELESAVHRGRLRRRLARYHAEQPLFRLAPQILSLVRDGELVPSGEVHELDEYGIARVGHTYCRLDRMLPPAIVHWARTTYPDAPLYVRLDPEDAFHTRPRGGVQESVLVPADPNWWRGLALHARRKTGGAYRLDPPDQPADDVEAYWEYHVCGVRRVETTAARRDADYLTMMFEELAQSGELLIGRCVHCDTRAPRGTRPGQAELIHLDLALNVYAERDVERRLTQSLVDGKVADATFRSHLLRLEAVPASAAVDLAFMFFRSRRLFQELAANQFRVGEDG